VNDVRGGLSTWDAPSGDVGGDQKGVGPAGGQKAASARSRWAWVRSPWMATADTPAAPELAGHPVSAAPRAAKDEARPCWLIKRADQGHPIGAICFPKDVGDLAHARLVGEDVVADRVALVLVDIDSTSLPMVAEKSNT